MVEINQRIFPYSFGVDLSENKNENLSLTITYPNIKAIGKNPIQGERTYVINTTGSSIFQGSKKLTTEVQGPFYFKHLRVIVLGEDLARDGKTVREVMDGLMRDFIINKRIHIAVVKGKAEDLLKLVPNVTRQESIEGTLFNLLNNSQGAVYFTPDYLSDFIQSMDKKGASIVPLIMQEGNGLKASGGGIFKDYKLVGFIDGKENAAITMLNGKVKTDVIDVAYQGDTISLNANNIKSTKKLISDGKTLKIKYTINIEGNIQEYILSDKHLLNDEQTLTDIEKTIEEHIKVELEKAVNILQEEYKADALGVGEFLHKFHPKIWEKVKNNWDESFAEMDIEIGIKVEIRRRGLIQ